MTKLPEQFNSIQRYLFPELEQLLGELSPREQEFIRAVELTDLGKHVKVFNWKGIGAKPHSRMSLLKAFIAKPIYQCKTSRVLIDNIKSAPSLRRLCGWERQCEIPSESTFSRAFAAFAEANLADNIHESMIKDNYEDKIVGHINRDSTSVAAREKACRKNSHGEKRKNKRGRPAKGQVIEKKPRRIEIQAQSLLTENLLNLPKECNYGTKKDSNGKAYTWKGYKLNLDCGDGGVPISAIVTSASMHDSQAAIPLMQMTTKRVTSFYDLMDAAYDDPLIHKYSIALNHIPIIDNNPRRGEKKEFEPAKAIRYNERSTSERANSELKDNYNLENIYVKGYQKVKCHIMFAVIALTAKALFNMLV